MTTPRALIVDDSLTVRMDLSSALENAGFEVALAKTGKEARDLISRPPSEQIFDLVILDIILPDDDGVEILKTIRESAERARTPVMLLSTEAEVRDRIRGLVTGADDYVGKPYDLSYVIARASELVRIAKAGAGKKETTILVIDGSPVFREVLRKEIEKGGYHLLLAQSGEEGLRLAASTRPRAILVDANLPGIDGASVIRRIRLDSALRRTPCALIASDEDADAEIRALEAGADALLKKTDDADVILARLAAVLRSVEQRPQDTLDDHQPSAFGPKKILAVDDSPTFLNELGNVLRTDGYDVVFARSGEESLELLAVEQFDCILLDMLMPGLGGEETCRRIKSAAVVRDTPLIMLTALDDRDAMINGLSAGADDYISKSSDFHVLRARVVAQIRRKQFEDENRRIREELLRKEIEAAESRASHELAATRATLLAELERKNKELEAFSYSVSHDLRAPLRSIDGFSQILLEDYGDKLDATGREHLHRVRNAAQRMSELIDDLLELSRLSKGSLKRGSLDLAELVREVFDELRRKATPHDAGPTGPRIDLVTPPKLLVIADRRMMQVLFENLVNNAIKFTSKTESPRIELGSTVLERDGSIAYFIRDNGAGFEMSRVDKLFAPFQRLHREVDFPGTGIGLATVARIIDRHGGRVWAEGLVGKGATIYFTLAVPS